jgi:hypothetical protein
MTEVIAAPNRAMARAAFATRSSTTTYARTEQRLFDQVVTGYERERLRARMSLTVVNPATEERSQSFRSGHRGERTGAVPGEGSVSRLRTSRRDRARLLRNLAGLVEEYRKSSPARVGECREADAELAQVGMVRRSPLYAGAVDKHGRRDF